jgi:hypothetical protein
MGGTVSAKPLHSLAACCSCDDLQFNEHIKLQTGRQQDCDRPNATTSAENTLTQWMLAGAGQGAPAADFEELPATDRIVRISVSPGRNATVNWKQTTQPMEREEGLRARRRSRTPTARSRSRSRSVKSETSTGRAAQHTMQPAVGQWATSEVGILHTYEALLEAEIDHQPAQKHSASRCIRPGFGRRTEDIMDPLPPKSAREVLAETPHWAATADSIL